MGEGSKVIFSPTRSSKANVHETKNQKDQPARMRIAKRTAHRLLSRSDPNGPLLRSVQDNVFVQNVGDHA